MNQDFGSHELFNSLRRDIIWYNINVINELTETLEVFVNTRIHFNDVLSRLLR